MSNYLKIIYVLLAGFFLSLPATAQYDYFVYDAGRFVPGLQVHTFVEKAVLRERPGAGYRAVTSVDRGSRVVIMSNTMVQSERNGVIQYWYQVGYTNDTGAVFRGFLEGHDLAVAALRFQVDYQRDLLVAQITGTSDDGSYILTAHILRAGSHTVLTAHIPFIPFMGNTTLPGYTFTLERNIQSRITPEAEVAELTYYHANDSMPAGTLYLLWTGEQLLKLCDAISMTEPDNTVREVMIIYPGREGVEAGSFRVKETITTYDPEKKRFNKPEQTISTHHWNGEGFD